MIESPTGEARRLEGIVDFDFAAVDSPQSVALDELNTIAAKLCHDEPFTMRQAKAVLAWGATQGVGPMMPVLEVAALWMGGCDDGEDVPLRAGVFVREFAPHARQAHSLRQLATYHRASRQMITKLSLGLRATLGIAGVGRYTANGKVKVT